MPGIEPMPVVRGERPRRRGNRKLLFFLFVFFVALLGVLFFQSSFSKIHQIEVEGNRLLTKEQIIEAAGIAVGDHFFAVSGGEIDERVSRLGAAEQVTTAKRFPGMVTIIVKEYPVVALELTDTGDIAGILTNATSVPYGNVENAASRPILSGWEDADLKRRLTETLASIETEHLQDVSEIRPSPTDSFPDRIVLYTRSKYEVVTRISYLKEKISLLDDYVYDLRNEDRTSGRIVLMDTNYAEALEEETEQPSSDAEE
ncbi:cell division protein FtsQ/DivIB [Paenibacillus antri]|uniref:cell division protein FtsQ/DivIB n=1 Tax=Paenibacillus antri TaxID=2582848 RepID=UPI0013054006|nr:FtsQ-type POTRA domain-containing protein [Paenibacillus antri]